MERSICQDFKKWIVQKHTVPREPAPNYHVIPLGRAIEHVAEFRQQMLKVAVHGENIFATCGGETICNGPAYSVRWAALQWFDARIFSRKLCHYLSRAIGTAIVYRDHFVNVFSIQRQDSLNQRTDIHLLVATRDDHRNGSAKRYMLEQ